MSVKILTHPTTGRTFKLGRRRPITRGPRLSLRKYLLTALPAPPTAVDYSTAAQPALRNIYLNDQLGDCVIAGGYHVAGVATGNAGDLFTATDAQITADYGAIGGYVPGNPATDNGCDEQTALNYWTETGFANGTKLAGWLAIDPANQTEIQQGMFLFENLYFGISLPDAWVNPMPLGDNFLWDVAGDPDPENGHCVMGIGYYEGGMMLASSGVSIDTWGMIGDLTFAAIAKYCTPDAGGAIYTLLTPDVINRATAKAPTGFDWEQLQEDFAKISS